MNKYMIFVLLALAAPVMAREYHVSVQGNDANEGSAAKPLQTISAAARLAQPGDVITVHEGVYREWINPPRGGDSDQKRIVYQAAPGEKVVLKGSEPVKSWEKVQNDTWKVRLPNAFFGKFNPYSDPIKGDWFNPMGRAHHTGAVYLQGHWLVEAASLEQVLGPVADKPIWITPGSDGQRPKVAWISQDSALWFAQVDATHTTLYAQFKDVNPNQADVEINVRRAVFYPEKPGVNYLTVRGFTMMHAATPWAPPTAEQIGLIGTHWSKGWIIENNDVGYSTCTGITLGKHGDQFDNTSQNTAEGYVKTIERGLAKGWSRENIGHHLVRNNRISHCEQAGLVGSLGAVFSVVTGNVIHDIHVRGLFTGAEMAGIKIHAAIDTQIVGNHIHRTCRGIWLDWMTQGTRVARNVLHNNAPWEDLMVEVSHGPYLVENNIFLSRINLLDMSQGGAYVHNLFAGILAPHPEMGRETPFHKAHSTEVVALHRSPGGDNRYYNNIFINPTGLAPYDKATLPMFMAGNVFLKGAAASKHERKPLVLAQFDPQLTLEEDKDGLSLNVTFDNQWADAQPYPLVTTELLGKAKIPDLPYEQPDGSPYRIDTDYFGKQRNPDRPFPGPFELTAGGKQRFKLQPAAIPHQSE